MLQGRHPVTRIEVRTIVGKCGDGLPSPRGGSSHLEKRCSFDRSVARHSLRYSSVDMRCLCFPLPSPPRRESVLPTAASLVLASPPHSFRGTAGPDNESQHTVTTPTHHCCQTPGARGAKVIASRVRVVGSRIQWPVPSDVVLSATAHPQSARSCCESPNRQMEKLVYTHVYTMERRRNSLQGWPF